MFLAVLLPMMVAAQSVFVVKENKQQKFHKSMPPGNYSGITYLGDDRYAVVDDKSLDDGYYIFRIAIDSINGRIINVYNEGFEFLSHGNTDLEGVAYMPQYDSIFVIGEKETGIESLTYNSYTHRFWTTTEVPEVGVAAGPKNPVVNRLRFICYDDSMNHIAEYYYEMDKPQARRVGANYAFGVSELCALNDGSLLVLEREFWVPKLKIGAWCICKLYVVYPSEGMSDKVLPKTLLWENKSRLNILSRKLANYEGMCLGPRLVDGSRVLLLVADSQYRYKGVMKDWLKTIVLNGQSIVNQ